MLSERIQKRKIVRWSLGYLAGAWVALQVVTTLGAMYAWPAGVVRALPVLLIAGFFATLVIAWFHGERGEQRTSALEVALIAGIVVVGGGAALAEAHANGVIRSSSELPALTDSASRPTRDVASIAVLPFKNVGGDTTQEFFSDGLTEEVLNELTHVVGLRVAARTSAFAFKNKSIPADSIGRALHVTYLLEGSVRREGSSVRVMSHLTDVRTGYEAWSEAYNRDVKDIFAVQNEISKAVVVKLGLNTRDNPATAVDETNDPEAHIFLLRGMATRASAKGRDEATQLYSAAIARDPNYARAYARLADVTMWQAYYRSMPKVMYDSARVLAQKAVKLNPSMAEAHVVLGQIADLYDWNFAKAEEHFKKAEDISPGSARVLSARAWLWTQLGRSKEAIAEAQRAIDVDPLSAGRYNTLGLAYGMSGHFEQALNAFESAYALDSTYTSAMGNIATTLSHLGRHAEAIAMAERRRAMEPDLQFTLVDLGRVYARAGRQAEATAALRRLLAMQDVSPYRLATIYAAMGDMQRAMDMVERTVREHDDSGSWVAVTPDLAMLHPDPRFQSLMRSAGLPVPK